MKPRPETDRAPTGKVARWTSSWTLSSVCLASTARRSEKHDVKPVCARPPRSHRITAQRPVAPLRLNKSQDESEVNMTSTSDSGGVETVMTTSGEVRDTTEAFTPKTVPEVAESLESMAMLGQPGVNGVLDPNHRASLPRLRRPGEPNRTLLSALWPRPLMLKREVESRSPFVPNEDGKMSCTSRDYYDVPGVEKSASASDLKTPSDASPRKYHPDRSTEDDAEDRFKEIQEAYAVLSGRPKAGAVRSIWTQRATGLTVRWFWWRWLQHQPRGYPRWRFFLLLFRWWVPPPTVSPRFRHLDPTLHHPRGRLPRQRARGGG